MSYSKSLTTLFVAVVCAVALSADAGQRAAGHAGGSSARAGTAAPRGAAVAAPRGAVVAPYRGGVYPYGGYRPYYPYPYRYGPGLSLGLYAGFGYPYYYGYGYGYPYYYGYGYPYPYAYSDPYAYAPAPDPGYVTAAPSYDPNAQVQTPGYAPQQQQARPAAPVPYGSLRIDGAPRGAEVFADGYDIGPIDNNGVLERVDLPAGPHKIEIRVQGQSSIVVNVSVRPGETTKFRAR